MRYDLWGLAALVAVLCVLLLSPHTDTEREAMRMLMAGLIPR